MAERSAHCDAPVAPISTMSYRSRAVVPMSEMELHRLARHAQARNEGEQVTGLMVYDHGWIFQQLEGPADGLARIWASIRRDGRHQAIDVLSTGCAEKRLFLDWDLRLTVRGAQASAKGALIAADPPELIGQLCRGVSARDLLGLAPALVLREAARSAIVGDALLLDRAVLANLIGTVIVPGLCAQQRLSATQAPTLSAALAALLIAADPASAYALVATALDRFVTLGSLATELLEPAARGLGDLWQSDDCSDIEVTVGLMRLQSIAREFGLGAPRLQALDAPLVLVTPIPGEAHMLGAALDAEMLWQAGWSPRVDFPSSSGALDALVASTWVDALDLSLSTCFRRDHRLDQVGKTIASARLASLNPRMVVVVSGRVFSDFAPASEAAATGLHIGADGTFGTASQAHSSISRALRNASLSMTPTRSAG